jgi:sugar lactone lactonase YvrE
MHRHLGLRVRTYEKAPAPVARSGPLSRVTYFALIAKVLATIRSAFLKRLRVIAPLSVVLACLLCAPCSSQARDILVSSRFSDNVLRFDGASGAFKSVFASGNGLDNPNGIAYGRDGNLYVGLGDVGRVMVFDGQSGSYVRDFVSPASSGGMTGSRAIAFLPDGDLLVDNGPSDNVLRFARDTGVFKGIFASGNGMRGPVGLAISDAGLVYVGAALSNAVYVYDASGSLVRTLTPPVGRSQVTGVEFDGQGKLLVAMSVSNVVLRMDPVTGEASTFATGGALNTPIGLAHFSNGDLLVGSFANDKVIRYDGISGALIGDFIASGAGGLDGTHNFAVVPDPLVMDDRFDGAWTLDGANAQGVFIDVSPALHTFFAAVFTYVPNGGQPAPAAWYVFQGDTAAAGADFTIYRVPSGTFFGAQAAALEATGTGRASIGDCNRIDLHLAFQGLAVRDATITRTLPDETCAR